MTNDELVMKLQENGVIKHEKVMKAFKFTDRGDFVPYSKRNSAYSDRPFKSER